MLIEGIESAVGVGARGVGAGDVTLGIVNTVVGAGEMIVSGLGAQADSSSTEIIIKEKKPFFMFHSSVRSGIWQCSSKRQG